MKKHFSILKKLPVVGAMIFISAGFVSCNYLDFDESSGYETPESLFDVFNRAETFLTNVYSYLPSDLGSFNGAMQDCATDDAQYVWTDNNIHTFNNGRWSQSYTIDDNWKHYYEGIRAANQFIKIIKEIDYSKYKWDNDYESVIQKVDVKVAEARALRAFFLFELAKRYKDIPLAIDIYTPETANTITKSSFADVIDYISTECLEASKKLLANYETDAKGETGRITKGASLALRARALLYAASPLYAGTDGDNLDKWKAAAAAAKNVMDLNLYSLVKEKNINNLASKELIYERRVPLSCNFEKFNFPISFDKGKTGNCPSQNLVDAFQTKKGFDVVLTENGFESDDPDFKKEKPFENRDPRFYSTILYDGATFKGKILNCAEGGDEGYTVNGASKTGYYLKKYVEEDVELSPVEKPVYHYWVLFRYAEVLLNYAEAMNMAYGADAKPEGYTMSATDALNKVRERADMPQIETGLDKDEFQEKVERERRVELAFEGHRFWDVRRWKKAGDVSLKGVRIVNAGGKKTYKPVVLENSKWEDKMYLYPIPVRELYINKNLYPQNEGWD